MDAMKVLLAVDGSSFSDAALDEVARRPWPEGTEVRVVSVDPPVAAPEFTASPVGMTAYQDLVQRLREETKSNLQAAAARLRERRPDLAVSAVLCDGIPKEQIVSEARRWGADLIAVGSHGRGALKSLFLGSVSLGVVLHAPCSVLIVRKPAAASEPA